MQWNEMFDGDEVKENAIIHKLFYSHRRRRRRRRRLRLARDSGFMKAPLIEKHQKYKHIISGACDFTTVFGWFAWVSLL